MSSDYEISSDDGDYYDSDEMMEDVQNDDEDMDMDEYNDDFKLHAGSKEKLYEVPHKSLSQSSVEKSMRDDVDHICGILGVEPSVAALLLRNQEWNKERLIEKYMENGTKVLVNAGAFVAQPASEPRTHSVDNDRPRRPTRSSTTSSKFLSRSRKEKEKEVSTPTSDPETFICPICFDDSPELKQLSLDCGHAACSGCWNDYTVTKIKDEGEYCIRCMAEGCAVVATDDFIRNLLIPQDPQEIYPSGADMAWNKVAWTRFRELLVRNFVSATSKLKFCPYPGCTNTVECSTAADKSVLMSMVPTVSCGARGLPESESESSQAKDSGKAPVSSDGPRDPTSLQAKEHIFCFGCPIEGDHRPVVCAVAKMWMKKCEDDSETANWIKSNTKECSQCQSTIEKNGGCNHMTCKKCKYEFCWVCMGPWSEHGTAWYSCNRYDEKGSVEARDAQSRSRASLERYLHYYNRWANHEQSARLSLELYAKTEKKMQDLQLTSSLTWIEVQFMRRAVEEVEKCRMTLKWTYSMAYYLAKGNEKDLFEDNQRDLEKAVEDLSELLESPIEAGAGDVGDGRGYAERVGELKQKVTDKTVYVQKRNEIVLEDTAIGFLDGRWRWNVSVDGFDEPEEDMRVD